MQILKQLTPRVSYLTPVNVTDRPILASVQGDQHTLMIDAGNSEAHATVFLEKLAEVGIRRPSLVAITHWHWDHVFGLAALQGVPSISSADTKRDLAKLLPFEWDDEALQDRVEQGIEISFCAKAIQQEFPLERNIRIKLPSIVFEDELTVDLGNLTCVFKQVGGDHAPDGIIIYIKEERIVFLADAIAPNLYAPSWRFTAEETIKLLDNIEEFEADTYIISHWKPISRSEYVFETELMRTVAELVTSCYGDRINMITSLEKQRGRKLTEDEDEMITYFINGYSS